MPRDIPLGNGNLLVAFDQNYRIRELFWPHVGQENHALGHPFRTGAWVEGQFRWFDDGKWQRSLKYEPETLVSAIEMQHPDLQIALHIADTVDFHEDLFLRRMEIWKNMTVRYAYFSTMITISQEMTLAIQRTMSPTEDQFTIIRIITGS